MSSAKNTNGAIWSLMAVGINTFLYFLFLSQASKVISDAEFGIFAILSIILVIGNTLQDFGFSSFIIVEKTEKPQLYNSLFSLNILMGIGLAILLALTAYPISLFFESPELLKPFLIISPLFLFSSLTTTPLSLLNKHFKLREIALSEISARVLSFGLAFYTLKMNWGLYSLILFQGLNFILKPLFLMSFIRGLHKFKIEFDKEILKPALKFGANLFGGQMLNQLRLYIDGIILAKFIGTAALGPYSLAKELILRPLSLLNPVIRRVALPNFAKYSEEPKKLSLAFFQGLTLSSALFSLTYFLIFVNRNWISDILYNELGPQVSSVLKILFLLGVFRSSSNMIGPYIQSIHRPDLEFKWNIYMTILLPIVLYFGVQNGIDGVTYTLASVQLFILLTSFFYFLNNNPHLTFLKYCTNTLGVTLIGVPVIWIPSVLVSSIYLILTYCGLLILLKKRGYFREA